MSVRLMADVWDNGPADATECAILLALANFADDKGGNCYPGNERLAHMARCTERTVTARIKTLTAGGWISVEQRGSGRGLASSYRLDVTRLKGEADAVKVEADVTKPVKKVEADVTERVKLTPERVKLTTKKVEADVTLLEPSEIHHKNHQGNHQSELPLDAGFSLPPWIDPKVWKAWEDHRRKLRFAMTDYARSLLVKKLSGFRDRGVDPNYAIDHAIEKGWRGFYEPPPQNQDPRTAHGRPTQFLSAQERKNAAHTDALNGMLSRRAAAAERPLDDPRRAAVRGSLPEHDPADRRGAGGMGYALGAGTAGPGVEGSGPHRGDGTG